MCRDKSGDILSRKEIVIERWAENFEERLNLTTDEQIQEPHYATEQEHEESEVPSLEEVRAALQSLKNNKAPGSDGMPAELLKVGGDATLNMIHHIIKLIWEQAGMPIEWNTAVIVPIHKKGDVLMCDNYRGISLLNVAYKVLANVVYKRLQPHAEKVIGNYQSGFCRGKSTIDQIFTMRQIIEKSYEFNMGIHNLFVDFKSAYDTINRDTVYKAMLELGIPHHLIRLVKLTLADVKCRVRIQNELSRPFSSYTGLRQGDALSCLLFNLALESVIRKTELNRRGTIMTRSVQILAFADDVNIIARSQRDMSEAFLTLSNAAKEIGLQINYEKTKYQQIMDRTGRRQIPLQNITIDTHNIEVVTEFVYLGSLVNNNNDMSAEIKRRIYLASRAYFGLNRFLKSDILSRRTKCQLYRVLIKPVLMYASETWTLTQNDERLLGTFERKILRHIYKGINENGEWRRRYNFELYQEFKQPDIVTSIKIGRLRWMGHVERMSETETAKQIIRQVPVGKRVPGRPKARYMEQVQSDIATLNIQNWKIAARNRAEWKKLLEQAKTLRGLSSQ